MLSLSALFAFIIRPLTPKLTSANSTQNQSWCRNCMIKIHYVLLVPAIHPKSTHGLGFVQLKEMPEV